MLYTDFRQKRGTPVMTLILAIIVGVIVFAVFNSVLDVTYFGCYGIAGVLLTCIVIAYWVFTKVFGWS